MVRGAFLIRIVCSLALLVAAWPVRAGASACAPKPEPPACGMACCAPKATKAPSCGCTLKSVPPAPAPPVKAAAPAFEIPIVVDLSVVASFEPPSIVFAQTEPGVVGVDAGPPKEPPRRADSGRAPPVDRA